MSSRTRPAGSVLSTVLWGVQFAVTGVLIAVVYFMRIAVPRCDQQCDFELLDAAGNVFAAFAVLLFIAVGALRMLLPGPSRWWMPAGGIALTIVGAAIAVHVSQIALLNGPVLP